jgi:hypothetical protein
MEWWKHDELNPAFLEYRGKTIRTDQDTSHIPDLAPILKEMRTLLTELRDAAAKSGSSAFDVTKTMIKIGNEIRPLSLIVETLQTSITAMQSALTTQNTALLTNVHESVTTAVKTALEAHVPPAGPPEDNHIQAAVTAALVSDEGKQAIAAALVSTNESIAGLRAAMEAETRVTETEDVKMQQIADTTNAMKLVLADIETKVGQDTASLETIKQVV